MTTQILNLPKVTLQATVATNEDWLSVVAFVDANNNPIALDGIAFTSELRATAGDATVWVSAGTATSDLVTTSGQNTLKWNVLAARMGKVAPGTYVFDAIGTADGHTRELVTGTLTVTQGITR
jgi:hypothetical protein